MTKQDFLIATASMPMDSELMIVNSKQNEDGSHDQYDIDQVEPFEDEQGRGILLFANLEPDILVSMS